MALRGSSQVRLRQIHRTLAPIVVLPLLITLITGSLYQIANLTGKGGDFFWLLQLHKGHFGPLNLDVIYPFLNALGLVVMIGSGFSMWLQMRRLHKSSKA